MPLQPAPQAPNRIETSNVANWTPAQIREYYTAQGVLFSGEGVGGPGVNQQTAADLSDAQLAALYQSDIDQAEYNRSHGLTGGGFAEKMGDYDRQHFSGDQSQAGVEDASILGFHPGTTHYDNATGMLVYDTANNPGVSLDPAAFENSAALDEYRARSDDMYANNVGIDPTRFDVNPNEIQSLTDVGGAGSRLDEMQANLAHNAIRTEAAKYDRTGGDMGLKLAQQRIDAAGQNLYQQDAGSLLRNAAQGNSPSAAENMSLRAGLDARNAYQQAGADAQFRARTGGDAALAAQYALAASSRGNVAGLAGLQAQNNAASVQQGLYSQAYDQAGTAQRSAIQAGQQGQLAAAQVRADEMAGARQQFAGFGSDVRGQDLSQAGQAAALAQQRIASDQAAMQNSQFNVGQSYQTQAKNLDVNMANANAMNTAIYNSAEAEAARRMAAQQGNQARDMQVAQANQQLASQRYTQDQQIAAGALASGTQQATNEQANQIQYETQYSDTIQSNATRAANERQGVATMAENKRQFDANRVDNMIGTAVGTAGAVVGAAVSDERTKNITGHRDPYDFSNAEDDVYTYKPSYQGKLPGADSREHIGPMAQDLPDDVQYTQDGKRVVDLGRLALRLAPAVGELQRKQKQLEARK